MNVSCSQKLKNNKLFSMYGFYIEHAYKVDINPLPALRERAGGAWHFIRNISGFVPPSEDGPEWAAIEIEEKDATVLWFPETPKEGRALK